MDARDAEKERKFKFLPPFLPLSLLLLLKASDSHTGLLCLQHLSMQLGIRLSFHSFSLPFLLPFSLSHPVPAFDPGDGCCEIHWSHHRSSFSPAAAALLFTCLFLQRNLIKRKCRSEDRLPIRSPASPCELRILPCICSERIRRRERAVCLTRQGEEGGREQEEAGSRRISS